MSLNDYVKFLNSFHNTKSNAGIEIESIIKINLLMHWWN